MATDDIPFDRSISAHAEDIVAVSPRVRRVIANNGGPFTFTGTCSYIVGQGEVAIVDPGPRDPSHIATLLRAVGGERVGHILVTHTHRDHAGGAMALKRETGAALAGCRGREAARQDLAEPVLDAVFDTTYRPDVVLADGASIETATYKLTAVETPGHTSDHLAFAFPEERALFSGDHVMAWSTTVVVPPDGSMRQYMGSLQRLLCRDDDIYWPGHGGPVRDPRAFVKALLLHRQWREAAILRCLAAGEATVPEIVAKIYRNLAPSLKGAAAQSVLAHLIDLAERDIVAVDGAANLRGVYRSRA